MVMTDSLISGMVGGLIQTSDTASLLSSIGFFGWLTNINQMERVSNDENKYKY